MSRDASALTRGGLKAAGLTRGERNNNPGNIDYSPHNAWHGQLGLELVPDGGRYTPRFARFDTMENGIRAIGKLLLAYYREHNCDSVRKLLTRWAPASENDISAYVADVSHALHVHPDAAIDVRALLVPLTRAVIRHENGRCLADAATVTAACTSALA